MKGTATPKQNKWDDELYRAAHRDEIRHKMSAGMSGIERKALNKKGALRISEKTIIEKLYPGKKNIFIRIIYFIKRFVKRLFGGKK